MVNEINGVPVTSSGNASNKGEAIDRAGTENQSQPSAPTQETSDSFELSSEAQLLSRLERRISDLPDIDQARIDELREAIDNGDFQVDDESLAQRIINFEL